jgi:hypothetical protein
LLLNYLSYNHANSYQSNSMIDTWRWCTNTSSKDKNMIGRIKPQNNWPNHSRYPRTNFYLLSGNSLFSAQGLISIARSIIHSTKVYSMTASNKLKKTLIEPFQTNLYFSSKPINSFLSDFSNDSPYIFLK